MSVAADNSNSTSHCDIVASGLGIQFDGSPVLTDVSFTSPTGQFTSIVGPSGCGKSTLLRCVAALTKPTAGELSIAGTPADQSKARVGFVFQDATLLPWRTVLANIGLPLELQGVAKEQRAKQVDDARKLIGLQPSDQKKLPRMLSGGMRMRVSLARALVTQPQILLLDEPFAALDDMLRQQLNEELSNLWLQRKWTTMFVTHNVAEAVYLSQRILVLGKQPATIVADVEVDFPYPRTAALRSAPEFAKLTGLVSSQLRADS